MPDNRLGDRIHRFVERLKKEGRPIFALPNYTSMMELRTALKQGETESRFFLEDREIGGLLYHGLEAERGDKALEEAFKDMKRDGKLRKEAFKTVDGVRRCLFFDAIELIDRCIFLKEAEK